MQTSLNIISSVATATLALGTPFGYLPKVNYIRGFSFNTPDFFAFNPTGWEGALQSNRAIIDTLARADDFETMEDLTSAVGKHIDPVVPANAAILDINISGALLYTAVDYKLIPLAKTLLNIGAQLIPWFQKK